MMDDCGIKLFETDEMASRFTDALRTIADSILSFISHGVDIWPIVTRRTKEECPNTIHNDIVQWKKDNMMNKTIIDIIIAVFPDRSKIHLFREHIRNIDIDDSIKSVSVESTGIINRYDIQKLEMILTDILFHYYNVKLIEARQIRSINISSIADPRTIFSAFQKIKDRNTVTNNLH